eukprot:scaffold90721_cov54-Phaeocystis_antarctica.AAC.1
MSNRAQVIHRARCPLEALDSRRAQCARDRGARQFSASQAQDQDLDCAEDAACLERIRGLLGHHGPGVRARPSRFLHQPQDASGLDNLIQTQTTPAERGARS